MHEYSLPPDHLYYGKVHSVLIQLYGTIVHIIILIKIYNIYICNVSTKMQEVYLFYMYIYISTCMKYTRDDKKSVIDSHISKILPCFLRLITGYAQLNKTTVAPIIERTQDTWMTMLNVLCGISAQTIFLLI